MSSSVQTCGISVLIKIIITILSDGVVKNAMLMRQFLTSKDDMGLTCILEGSLLGRIQLGLKETINWFGNLRFPSVPIKLDCKQVVGGISSNLNTNFMFCAILNSCKVSLQNHQNFNISFIKRQTNNVAHLLALTSLLTIYITRALHEFH